MGIQAKLKICTGCQEPSYIYKSENKSDKFCKQCWFKKEKHFSYLFGCKIG
jgi:hypothetical protein